MLRNFLICCLIFPFVVEGEITTYVTRPVSVDLLKKGIENFKEEIANIEAMQAQKVYDQLSSKKKEITDRNLLEIYYTVISFLRVQSNNISGDDLKDKLNSLIDRLNWLYSDHENEKFTDKITNLTVLLKPEIFIHLDHKKMVECLDMAHHIKDVIEYSNIRNELGPEDGSDFFNSDFFLQKEIKVAQQISSQVTDLENIAQGFSSGVESLSKEQISTNITQANHFINNLKFTKIDVDGEKVEISRNVRKHLNNLASSSIEKLIEKKNQFEY